MQKPYAFHGIPPQCVFQLTTKKQKPIIAFSDLNEVALGTSSILRINLLRKHQKNREIESNEPI